MDTRKALEQGQVLNFSGGAVSYRIQKESARGGSSLVYDAVYQDNIGEEKFVRIKECYPFSLTISRAADGTLVPAPEEADAFAREKENMRAAYRHGNEFFRTDGLTNFTANTYNLYEANQTIYIISSYSEGEKLSYEADYSLRERISLVRAAAFAIQKIHEKGYLYLDIKPDNIFTLKGTTEIIQLFDFDSLFPIRAAGPTEEDYDGRIAYTKGFAAPEQRRGDRKRIGIRSDIYGIGALLFYLIFGRTPDAPDCGPDADYDFTVTRFSMEAYSDTLFFKLKEFFRRTLSDYSPDRYPNMKFVTQKLDELKTISDTTVPFLYSAKIPKPEFLAGRTEEKKWLADWFSRNESNCLFVTGMGGIGKSTLVRSFLAESDGDFDTILYTVFAGTLMKTLLDENQIQISNVRQAEQESENEYLERKLNAIRQLCSEKNVLLVIDDYTGEEKPDLSRILRIPWRLLLICRNCSLAEGYLSLNVTALKRKKSLYVLFEHYLGRSLTKEELPFVERILLQTAGHTLTLELIAKQITKSYLSLEKASTLTEKYGFLKLAQEKINVTKDFVTYHETIRGILDQLFRTAHFSEKKQTILKILAFFGSSSVKSDLFGQMLGLSTKDEIDELCAEGWLSLEEEHLTMHPLIQEIALSWPMTKEIHRAAAGVMDVLNKGLSLKKGKEIFFLKLSYTIQYKKEMKQNMQKSLLKLYPSITKKYLSCKQGKKERTYDRILRSWVESMMENQEMGYYRNLAECFLEKYQPERTLKEIRQYSQLLFKLIYTIPTGNEKQIIKYYKNLFCLLRNERLCK